MLRGCAASREPLFGHAAIDIVFSDVSEADIQDHLFPFARVSSTRTCRRLISASRRPRSP